MQKAYKSNCVLTMPTLRALRTIVGRWQYETGRRYTQDQVIARLIAAHGETIDPPVDMPEELARVEL